MQACSHMLWKLLLIIHMGDALKIRPQDVGPVPEVKDADIDSLIETYLAMENQNNWFKFGPYSTIEKGHSISGPGLLECKTLAEVFLEQQPTARLPLAQFKKGVIRALEKNSKGVGSKRKTQ